MSRNRPQSQWLSCCGRAGTCAATAPVIQAPQHHAHAQGLATYAQVLQSQALHSPFLSRAESAVPCRERAGQPSRSAVWCQALRCRPGLVPGAAGGPCSAPCSAKGSTATQQSAARLRRLKVSACGHPPTFLAGIWAPRKLRASPGCSRCHRAGVLAASSSICMHTGRLRVLEGHTPDRRLELQAAMMPAALPRFLHGRTASRSTGGTPPTVKQACSGLQVPPARQCSSKPQWCQTPVRLVTSSSSRCMQQGSLPCGPTRAAGSRACPCQWREWHGSLCTSKYVLDGFYS